MRILNETGIASATLGPVIRRQVYAHAGVRGSATLVVRVYPGRRATVIAGRAWVSRNAIAIVIPRRLILNEQDWQAHAPRLAQVTAILAARFSKRHQKLAQRAKFQAAPETIDEFSVAADVPYEISDQRWQLSMEARLEWVILERRRTKVILTRHKRRYQRWRALEKVLRHRLRKLGSQVA